MTIHVDGVDADVLAEAASAATVAGAPMKVAVFEPRRKAPELTISEGGGRHGSGCACSMLAESADWDAPTWDMTPDARQNFARTIQLLARNLPRPFSVEALWDGDPVEREHRVTLDELVSLASTDALGTRDRYIVTT